MKGLELSLFGIGNGKERAATEKKKKMVLVFWHRKPKRSLLVKIVPG